jgi:hypothetical protein
MAEINLLRRDHRGRVCLPEVGACRSRCDAGRVTATLAFLKHGQLLDWRLAIDLQLQVSGVDRRAHEGAEFPRRHPSGRRLDGVTGRQQPSVAV